MAQEPALDPRLLGILQAGLDHIDQGISVFDRQLHMVAWNRRFLQLLDFPDGLAFRGAEFESFIRYNALRQEYGPGDPEAQIAERVRRARQFEPHVLERTRPDGRILQVKGAPIPEGGFVTVYTDITAQKQRDDEAERLIADRTAALRLSEERLRLIANEVPAGIAHVDRDLRIQFVNARFARAYGRTPDEMIGHRCSDILSGATVRFSAPFFEQARRGAPVDFDMTLRLPDGRVREVRTFLRPEQPSVGEVIGFYLMSIDVTRQKLATATMLQAQKMDAIGQLSSGIAHDFNNLLTIIIGNLSPLQDRLGESEMVTELVEPALRAARRGAGLTRRLLTVARRQPLQPMAVGVDDAIGDLVKLLRPSLPEDIEVVSASRGRCPAAFVDPAQLEMALLNLALNARDALQEGGRIAFSTGAHDVDSAEAEALKIKPGAYVRISVEDDGHGIREEVAGRVFEPFYSTKPDGGGSGLGLSMVYGFIRQSNGAITFDSTPGEGTRFVIYLPAAEEAAAAVPAGRRAPGAAPGSGALTLLVEDNDEVRSVVRRQLVDLGHPIVEAQDGAEALDMLDAIENIELLVSDIAMPGGMSGIDLAHRVRSMAPSIGIVLMTGHSGATHHDPAGGSFPVLRKPFDKAELAEAIAAIGRARQLAQLREA